MKLKNRDRLLRQISAGIKKLPRTEIKNIKITISNRELYQTNPGSFEFDLPTVLAVIALDLYWDSRGNWSDADTAIVETF